MDKQTLSNYGWLVIVTLILAVMLALVTPFGTYVGDAVVSVANGYVGASNNAMDNDNIGKMEQQWDDKLQQKAECGIHKVTDFGDHSAITECSKGHKFACECGWTVPEGGIYYAGVDISITDMRETYPATTIYTEGQNIPCSYTSKENDIFIYNDLEYRRNRKWSDDNKWIFDGASWDARVIDNTKEYYKPVIDEINGSKISFLTYTYKGCTNLKEIPELPETISRLSYTFYDCTSLSSVDYLPNNISEMHYTFCGCTNLSKISMLPNNLTNMNGTFRGCTSLKSIPSIPSTVTTLNQTFYVSGLEVAPIIPNGVTDMDCTFARCNNLKTYEGSQDADYDFSEFVIPNSVTDIESFIESTKITKAPVIPASVKIMKYSFRYCSKLSGTVTINCNPTVWTQALYGTQITTIAGSTTMQSQLLASKTTNAENPTA